MKLLSILNLIIAAQAIFLGLHFLLKSKGIGLLNKLLALLNFCFAFVAMNTYINFNDLLPMDSIFQDIANNFMWFISPTLYLYVIYNKQEPNRNTILAHTLPYLVPAAIDIFFDWPQFSRIIPFIAFTQMSIYLFLSIRYSLKNYAKAKQFYSWILPSIVVFSVLIFLNFTLSILLTFNVEILPNSVLQSFTSLLGVPIFYLAYKEMNSTNDFGISPKKYSTTSIPEEKSKAYLSKIESAIKDDKLFLNKTLTLQSFSKYVDIPPRYISQVINQYLQMSFTDYLLIFRLEEVKKNLKDPEKKYLTIHGIAQESGFNSNSRFNYLFKKDTGLTPKQFQKLHLK